MKKQLSKKDQILKLEWEKMLKKHSKPLEKGAGTVKRKKPSKPETLIFEMRCSRDTGPSVSSHSTGDSPAPKRVSPVYTGEKVIGVSVIHKSCLQPIFNSDSAKEVAQMRR